MAKTVRITEQELRKAIADDLYWRSGDPDRESYVAWVTEGFRALHEAGDAGVVHVRAYERMRDGKLEKVAAHTRSAADGAATADEIGDDAETLATPAQALLLSPWPLVMFARPPILPRELGPPLRRVPNQSGKEGAKNTPSWARGATRHANEDPTQFAWRIMNVRWGEGNWHGVPARMSEFGKILKFGQRAFERP